MAITFFSLILIMFTLVIISLGAVTLNTILTNQVDQFKRTYMNIQTALKAEFRCNAAEWISELN